MNKKGQGLPLNTIIIAAIVLIVLVVLWAIFTGRMGVFTKGLKTTTEQSVLCTSDVVGGTVKDTAKLCTDIGGTIISGTFTGVTGDKVCCTK